MVLNFMTNDFIMIWNLLFGASISSESQDFKTTVWKNIESSMKVYKMIKE